MRSLIFILNLSSNSDTNDNPRNTRVAMMSLWTSTSSSKLNTDIVVRHPKTNEIYTTRLTTILSPATLPSNGRNAIRKYSNANSISEPCMHRSEYVMVFIINIDDANNTRISTVSNMSNFSSTNVISFDLYICV